VVVNACLDRVRRRRARPSVPRDDQAAVEARIMVQASLGKLPQAQRDAIVLVGLLEFSVARSRFRPVRP
jgi:RNA polymerase sigma-70 factor (ECF subfamily)